MSTDDFNRANSADLGSVWTVVHGTGFDIVSNTAVTKNVLEDQSEYHSDTRSNDQYSEITFGVSGNAGVGSGVGPTCRSSTSAVTFYRLVGSQSGYQLNRAVTGSFTSLTSGAGTTFVSGDVLRLEVRTNGANCDWILKKNGSQFANGTDTSPIASGRAGIGYSSTDASTITAWAADDLDVAPAVAYFRTRFAT